MDDTQSGLKKRKELRSSEKSEKENTNRHLYLQIDQFCCTLERFSFSLTST